MTLDNGSLKDVIRQRKEVVSKLRVMGMTVREIMAALPKQGIINPKTGEPYTHQTVQNDIEALRQEWRENAAVPTKEHQDRQLAEIQAVKRQAFLDRDGRLALSAIDQEMKLLGTAAPKEMKVNVNINYEVVTRVWTALEQADKNPEAVLLRLAEQAEQAERVH